MPCTSWVSTVYTVSYFRGNFPELSQFQGWILVSKRDLHMEGRFKIFSQLFSLLYQFAQKPVFCGYYQKGQFTRCFTVSWFIFLFPVITRENCGFFSPLYVGPATISTHRCTERHVHVNTCKHIAQCAPSHTCMFSTTGSDMQNEKALRQINSSAPLSSWLDICLCLSANHYALFFTSTANFLDNCKTVFAF